MISPFGIIPQQAQARGRKRELPGGHFHLDAPELEPWYLFCLF
jgi:hypothetical protein